MLTPNRMRFRVVAKDVEEKKKHLVSKKRESMLLQEAKRRKTTPVSPSQVPGVRPLAEEVKAAEDADAAMDGAAKDEEGKGLTELAERALGPVTSA
ncbi:MAG: hypothetical protein NXI04_16380, partial [Planctomycetaceae bacterium]|nr:hypothetical protein [Planctomycetaceae bacterium]